MSFGNISTKPKREQLLIVVLFLKRVMTQQEKKRNNKIKGDLLKFESLVAIQSGKKRYWLENTNEKKTIPCFVKLRSDQIGWALVFVFFSFSPSLLLFDCCVGFLSRLEGCGSAARSNYLSPLLLSLLAFLSFFLRW
jgi:hypothetical protein